MSKKKRIIDFKNVYLLVMFIASLFMCIGYASVNSVTLNLGGLVSVEAFKGIFLSDITILSSSSESHVDLFYETMMQSTVVLEDNINSTLSMQISVYNNSSDDYYFDDVVYGSNFYDNNNIDYTLSGINHGDKISIHETKTFTITFKYTDEYKNSNPTTFDNVLNSYINFRFKKGYSITYTNITTQSNYPTLVLDGENLSVTFSGDVPSDIKVIGLTTSTEYVSGTNYTYNNGVLTFNNVSENLEIRKVSSVTPGVPVEEVIENNDGSTTTITTVTTPGGDEVVVGYEIDTSDTNDGSIPLPAGGIDTGVLAFDGNDFTVTLKAKLYIANCTTTVCPIISVSKKESKVNGVLIYEQGNINSSNGYNPDATKVTKPYNKFRIAKYVNSSSATNIDFNIASKITSLQMNGRFAYDTSKSPITLTFKLYCISGVFSAEIYDENGTLIAKPYNNTTVSFDDISSGFDNITVVVGQYDGFGEGVTYTHNFDIIEFSVNKTIN